MEDLQLLALIRRGDEQAFDSLFRRYYESLVGFCGSLLHGRDMAEDVVQDVLLELWRRRESLDIDESCKAYLFRSVRNRALNEIRHEGTVKKLEPAVQDEIDVPSTPADTLTVTDELEHRIALAVSSLSAPVRECFVLSRRDGMTYNEIASVLSVSVKTVEARMGRALKELRSALAEWLPEQS